MLRKLKLMWQTFGLMAICCGLAAQPHPVIITEIYPDPDNKAGIPASEFIELKNVSGQVVNLKGWRITDGSATATINVSYDLLPDSFVVICPNAALPSFSTTARAIGVSSFPSLNNDADIITLLDHQQVNIHTIAYKSDWHANAVKKAGGWTLEMIDTRNPCGGQTNWTSSIHANGGTPGYANSVTASNADEQPPSLIRAFLKDSVTLIAVFDEPLDSTTATNKERYLIDATAIKAISVTLHTRLRDELMITLSHPFNSGILYTLTVRQLKDCAGNEIGMYNNTRFGIASTAKPGDVAINELLFNPAGTGFDYVELINKSNTVIDLKTILLAGKNQVGAFTDLVPVTSDTRLLLPGAYVVVTRNTTWLAQNYHLKDPAAAAQTTAFPSLPDDKGYIAVLNSQGDVIDELSYSEKWQFGLINSKDGVALERIDYSQPTQQADNWTSAASTDGFGTPGYQNSQFKQDLLLTGAFVIEQKLFSPDGDGYEDYASIRFTMPESGYMGSITIYDLAGNPVRYLLKSAVLGLSGVVNWDGLNEAKNRLPMGQYIVAMEVFNLKGKTRKFKASIALVRKF